MTSYYFIVDGDVLDSFDAASETSAIKKAQDCAVRHDVGEDFSLARVMRGVGNGGVA